MPIAVGTIAAKDGGGNTISGGLRAGDLSAAGDGTGPWLLGNFLVDGKAGTNRLGIFAEDTPAADGDTGIQVLTRRTDTAAASAGTDGDYQPFITDASGRLHVNVGNTVTVQPAGSVAHDAVGTGVNPLLEGGYASAAAPTDVSADGDSVRGWRLRNGAAATVITAAGALVGGDATNGLDVDVTRIIPGTSATHLGKAEDAAHASGDTGVMALAVRNDAGSALAGTDGDYIPLSTDNTGALRVTGGGGGTQYTDDAASATNPVGNMLMGVRRDTPSASEVSADGDNIAMIATSKGKLWTASELRLGDTAADTGIGAASSATLRVSIATDSQTASVANNADAVATSSSLLNTPTVAYMYGYNGTTMDRLQVDGNKALKIANDASLTDDAAFTPATSKVIVIGLQADETSTDSVDEGDAGAPRMTLDRKQIVTTQPHTKGGLLAFCSLDIDETEEDVKTSPGQVYGFHAANRTTSALYLRFYNATAANVTVGTTATFLGPFEIPANASDHTVEIANFGGLGVEFDTAISVSATTGFAANDTGAPATNACIVNVLYK